MIGPVQAIDPLQHRSHTSPRSPAMPADYTQCRVRKQSTECESEKRLVKCQRPGLALTEIRGSWDLGGSCCHQHRSRPNDRFAFTDYIHHIFSTESHVYNFRSVFEHAQSVLLHGRDRNRSPSRDYINPFTCTRDHAWRHLSLSFYLPPSIGLLLTVWTKHFVRVYDHAWEVFSLPSIGLLEQFF